MNKEQFIDGLKDRGINDSNIFALVSNAFDQGSKWEREECAKLCDYVYNNIVTDEHIKNMAFKIRARGQE